MNMKIKQKKQCIIGVEGAFFFWFFVLWLNHCEYPTLPYPTTLVIPPCRLRFSFFVSLFGLGQLWGPGGDWERERESGKFREVTVGKEGREWRQTSWPLPSLDLISILNSLFPTLNRFILQLWLFFIFYISFLFLILTIFSIALVITYATQKNWRKVELSLFFRI